ncbi:50S ribosomal protein L9 [Alkalidesulfovibrio alkalitolerans DSM 16529]|jgi:large subunit ribosomal protein L9|uniref:Large ribosomal subunit protein bL9 n=1 Tax=Alkalidesulfovibrio alkalitolerans DSM 16529 TaxID=1121439 RepID=S7T269_9BACT|nr:50S ribosomal protein L9 [Alkalidesulfovibrio alkalitolerans]EPR30610.1 50S ribosomal protein L9 [Alkalidesulfovibrio alkalitolerans DSM 16529]
MPVQIILRSDVDNLGRVGDTVKVKPGFARNFLIPQGLAMLATPSNLKQFELERKKLESKMDAVRSEARSLGEKLSAAVVEMRVRVGEGDKLYGSVTSAMIAEGLAAQGIEIDKRRIDLDAPIRALGEYAVPVKLHQDVIAKVTVQVLREGGSFEEEIAAPAGADVSEAAEAQEAATAPVTDQAQ